MVGPADRHGIGGGGGTGALQGRLHGKAGGMAPQAGDTRGHGGEEQRAKQPPPLTAAVQELLNNDIRSSTKATYKSKVRLFADFCAKAGTNTKTCH